MSKRVNGSGSVYKRKDVKNTPWRAVSPWQIDTETGERKRVTIGNFKTKKEALAAIEDWSQTPSLKINMTFEDTYNEWKSVAFDNIGKTSRDCYTAAFDKCKPIHKMKLKDVKTAELQGIIASYSSQSASALNKLRLLMHQVLKYGMQEDIITKNYAQFVVLPKKEKVSKEAFTDIEIKRIEDSVGKVPYADYILVMIYTGFRVGEFLNLTKFSYDPEKESLCGGSKTEAGKDREIPLSDKIIPIVKQQMLASGDYLFGKNGEKMSTDYFRKFCYNKALKEIGVRQLSPHSTRHTFATLLANNGVSPTSAQKLLGHTKYSLTAEVYVHKDFNVLSQDIAKIS